MTAASFDALKAARNLATLTDLRAEVAGFEARVYRTMLLQASAIAGIIIAAIKLNP